MKRAAVVADSRPAWQALIVAHGDLAGAKRRVAALLEQLADDGHRVIDARVDGVGIKPIRAGRPRG